VLIYDDFRRDNEQTMRRLLRFLEVDYVAPIAVQDANPTVGIRAQRLHQLVHAASAADGPMARTLKGALRTVAPGRISRRSVVALRNRVFYGSPPPPDQALLAGLRRRYKADVRALSEYLDRDLVTLWGYDAVE
jgi:hypothetical protein